MISQGSSATFDSQNNIPPPRSPFGSLILNRYVFQEVIGPSLLTLFVFTGILFLTKSLKLFELVVNKNVAITDIVQLFIFIVPQFLEMAIPMALLLGAVLAFGRLSSDSELVVMRATGIGMVQLLRPVMAVTLIGSLLCLAMGFWVRPWANTRLGMKMFEMAQLKASSGLVAGVFNEFGQLTIYAAKIDGDGGALREVIIADRRNPDSPRHFLAHHGSIISNADSRTTSVRLFDGSIHEGQSQNYNVTYFDVNTIVIDQSDLMGEPDTKEGKKASEMLIGELLHARSVSSIALADDEGGESDKELYRDARIKVELHRRIVIPLSCFVVAVLGMALGVQPSRSGKSWGTALNVSVGILLITLYYFVLAFMTALGEHAVLPAWVAMWIPNVLFGALGIFIFRRIETEEWATVSQAFGDLTHGIGARVRALFS